MSDTPALPQRYETYMLGNLKKVDDGSLMLANDILALNTAWSKVLDERDAKFKAALAAKDAALRDAVAKEREACAKLCDAEIKLIPMYRTRAEGIEARRLAAAIRARGAA